MLSVQKVVSLIGSSSSVCMNLFIRTARTALWISILGMVGARMGAFRDFPSRNAQPIVSSGYVVLRYETVPYPSSEASQK